MAIYCAIADDDHDAGGAGGETISQIQLCLKPERKHTATQDHSATSNKSHLNVKHFAVFPKASTEDLRHLGVDSCESNFDRVFL